MYKLTVYNWQLITLKFGLQPDQLFHDCIPGTIGRSYLSTANIHSSIFRFAF